MWCPDCLGQSSCAASTPVWEEGWRVWPASLLILLWPQPLTAPWLPGEGFSLAGLGMGPKPLPLGEVTTWPPGAKWLLGTPGSAKHLAPPALCQGHQGSVGVPGWCCLLLAHHRLAGLCMAEPLAPGLCRPPPLHSVLGHSARVLAAAKSFEQHFQVAGREWSRAGWCLCQCARRAACASPCQLIWGSTRGTAQTCSLPALGKLCPASATLGSAAQLVLQPLWWQ